MVILMVLAMVMHTQTMVTVTVVTVTVATVMEEDMVILMDLVLGPKTRMKNIIIHQLPLKLKFYKVNI